MSLLAVLAVTLASVVNSAMPGPCVVLTLGRSARSGAMAGLLVTTGLAVANLLLCVVALAITQGLMILSPTALVWMKWIGVLALATTAAYMMRARARPANAPTALRTGSTLAASASDVTAGLLVGLSSPFNLIFYLSLLPQFLPAHSLTAASALLISTAVLTGAVISYSGATMLGALSGGLKPQAGRWIECLGATCLVGFAVLAATSSL